MRRKWIGLLCAVMLLFSGCVANVESMIVPPTPAGEQQAIKKVLDDYIRTTYDTTNYLLHYPAEGAYTSAFVLLPDDPDAAVAFYRLRGEQSGNIHIHRFLRDANGWRSAGDAEGINTSVEEIGFADLNGDGVTEMLIGWSVYNSNDRSLHLCHFGEEYLQLQSVPGMYTKWHTADMTGDGVSELLLLRYAGEGRNTARLYALLGPTLTQLGETRIDGYIRKTLRFSSAKLSDSVMGLYIDAMTGGDARMTELLCWDGEQLAAPFYSAESNSSAVAARILDVTCDDINGDGVPEFPVAVLLEGYDPENAPAYAWRIDWCDWIPEEGTARRCGSSILFPEAGYAIYPQAEWYDAVTTRYDAGQGILWLLRDAGEPVLAVSVGRKLPNVPDYPFKEWHRDRALSIVRGAWYDPDGGYIADDAALKGVVSLLVREATE